MFVGTREHIQVFSVSKGHLQIFEGYKETKLILGNMEYGHFENHFLGNKGT